MKDSIKSGLLFCGISILLTLITLDLIGDVFDFNEDNNGCPILSSNYQIIRYRDCNFGEDYCLSINCSFTRWNCGRPACKCD